MDKFNLGELFVIGFHGTRLDDRLRDYLTGFSYGGIILFSRNIRSFDEWKHLTEDLQYIRTAQNKAPYFIAIDEEGGTVSRMPDDSCTLPGARALAETYEPSQSLLAGMTAGKVLSEHGCNLNLAPVLDVNVNPLNPGIGIRSFGTTNEDVIKYGLEFMKGLHSQGVLSCAKHFPGKGDIIRDSHKTSAVCNASKDQIFSTHLKPFEKAVSERIPFVMTSHAIYPAVDNRPATLSEIFLKNILRDDFGFNGLIISDDLEMGAMSQEASIGETAYRAIMAGCDMLLICHSLEKQQEAYHYIMRKLKTDKKLYQRCVESYNRIFEMKKRLADRSVNGFDLSDLPGVSAEIARKSVKIIRDKLKIFPLNLSVFDKKVLLAGAKFRSDVEVEIIGRTPNDITDLHNELAGKFNNLDLVTWDLKPGKINTCFDNYDLIFLCTNNAVIFDGQKKLVTDILANYSDKTVLIAVKNPEDIDVLPTAQTAIATYGYNKSNINALKKILAG